MTSITAWELLSSTSEQVGTRQHVGALLGLNSEFLYVNGQRIGAGRIAVACFGDVKISNSVAKRILKVIQLEASHSNSLLDGISG
jgi:hypothetical protein